MDRFSRVNNLDFSAIVVTLASIVFYIFFVFFFQMVKNGSVECSQPLIVFLSWVGIVCVVVYLIIWKRTFGTIFTLFSFFLLFYTFFNFGQCFLWAFGIHPDNEIGRVLLFSSVKSSNELIVEAQLLFIISFVFINCGALLSFNKLYYLRLNPFYEKGNDMDLANNVKYRALLYASIIVGLVSIPATLFRTYLFSQFVIKYGYALVGTTATDSINGALMNVLSSLFMPSLIGIIIGSSFKKEARIFAYSVFFVYAILSTMAGDRGEWITRLLVLMWLEFSYCRKISIKTGTKILTVGLVGLWLVQAATSLRNLGGVTVEKLIDALISMDSNPIISCLIEFGHSMAIVMILLSRSIVYPYGNTYVMSVLTMVSPGLTNGILGTNYIELQEWFPQQVLYISYGSDFSMLGEAVLNFGAYLAPLFLLVVGIVVFKITYFPYRRGLNPFFLCMSLNVAALLFKYPRSSTWFVLNYSIFGFLILGCVYLFFVSLNEK